MARGRGRVGAAIAALLAGLLGVGCALTEPVPTVPAAAPQNTTATAAQGWVEDLTFSGDLTGRMTRIVLNDGTMPAVCTGRRAPGADTWALLAFGYLGQRTYGLKLTVTGYRGPGGYTAPAAGADVYRPDQSAVWRSAPGDSVALTIDRDEEHGTLDASLTNIDTNQTRTRVTGTWSCQT